MRRNDALRLQYDGTAYHGWQVQKTDVTVAETLERALTKVCGARRSYRRPRAARTRACTLRATAANFRTDCTIPTDRVPLAVTARLPADIAVVDAVAAPEDFNAIGSCIQKEYVYQIYNSRIRDAFLEHRVCFYPQPLDCGSSAGRAAREEHATRVLSPSSQRRARPCARCTGAVPSATDDDLRRLLRRRLCIIWVRAIVGTMVYASYGKIAWRISALLAAARRWRTGPTVPPQGCINRVYTTAPSAI